MIFLIYNNLIRYSSVFVWCPISFIPLLSTQALLCFFSIHYVDQTQSLFFCLIFDFLCESASNTARWLLHTRDRFVCVWQIDNHRIKIEFEYIHIHKIRKKIVVLWVNESGRDRKSDLDRERRFSTGIGSSDRGSESVPDNTQCVENRIGIVFT